MIEVNAWLALKARMDQWTECPVMYPGVIWTPDASLPFLIVQDVGLSADDASTLSYNCGAEYRGMFNVSVMTPLNTWTYAQQKGLAARVGNHFVYGSTLSYGGTNVKLTQPSRIIGNTRYDSTHNRLEVQVPWLVWG